MKKIILLLAIPVIMLIACDSNDDICSNLPFVDSDISTNEEYLIVKAIINEESGNSNLSHISQETHFMSDSMRFSRYFKFDDIELDSDIIENYIEVNSVPHNWSDSFDTKQNLISSEEIICFFDNDGWISFYEKYPESDGYLKFGKPVLNDENEALVTMEYLCGWECSSGYTVTLIKENGKWQVRKIFNVWIS